MNIILHQLKLRNLKMMNIVDVICLQYKKNIFHIIECKHEKKFQNESEV